jgi:Ca2+-binding EF-hand superfamily protein
MLGYSDTVLEQTIFDTFFNDVDEDMDGEITAEEMSRLLVCFGEVS